MNKIPQNVSKSTIARNPHLYPAVGGLPAQQPERSPKPALDSPHQKRKKGKGCVEVIVTIIAFCRREADDDNNIASLKGIRDAISESIGIDDGDGRIKFQYSQSETRGKVGIAVKIELL